MTRGIAWNPRLVLAALELAGRGHGARAISRRLGVPRSTVGNWLRGALPQPPQPRCVECGGLLHGQPHGPEYGYLLGLYLGDGFLTISGSAVYLNVAMDTAYPGIIEECRTAVGRILPWRRTHVRPQPDKACVVIRSYGPEWRCLFPQHGPGRKHDRRIALARWQEEVVERHPGPFLRGLIHSDGWRGTNKVTAGGRAYAYPRYQFSNRSDDIRALFTAACDRLGVAWRPWGRFNISVARRDAVARLDEHVGPKA